MPTNKIDSDSSGDFSGFDEDDVDSANERLLAKNHELDEAYNESDIDVSDNSDGEGELSDQSDSENDDDDDPYLQQFNAEWTRELSEIIIPDFNEQTGVNHGLPSNSDQLQYFFRFLPQQFFENVAFGNYLCRYLTFLSYYLILPEIGN